MSIPVCEYPFTGSLEPQTLTEQIVQHDINVLVGVPAMLLQYAAELAGKNRRLPGIETILYGSESLFTEQLQLLKSAFPNARIASIGCACVDAGLIGLSTPDCLADEHRVFEPETIVEIIDEATGEPIDEINRSGMLVVTSLTRTLMPLIRYPVGDLAAWREPPGSKHRKFILQGRSSLGHRLRVGYASLFPDEIAALITEEIGHQQWQLMLEHADNRDRLSLRIAFSGTRQQADRLCGQLLARDHALAELQAAGQLCVQVHWCSQAELIRNTRTGKLQRVIDKRAYLAQEAVK